MIVAERAGSAAGLVAALDRHGLYVVVGERAAVVDVADLFLSYAQGSLQLALDGAA